MRGAIRAALQKRVSVRQDVGQRPGVPRALTLSEVHLMKSLDPGAVTPTTAQARWARGLARMCKAGLYLVFENIADVDLEGGLLAGEAPGLLRLMRLSSLRVCERVAGARPPGIKGDPAHHPVVRVISIADVGIEREQDVGLGGSDLADELLAQLQVLDQLGIRMAQEGGPLDPHHIRGGL